MIKLKKKEIELRKSGKFYNSFGDDAIIIHYLLGYKIVKEKGGVGFPESAFNKVINILENEEISYIVYEKDKIVEEKDFKRINNYDCILKKGLKVISGEERFDKIEKKIRDLNLKELDRVLEVIEDVIS